MTIYHVKPYRRGWLCHLVRFQFRTAFCALFGIVRWHIPARFYPILDNPGLIVTATDETRAPR